MINNPNADDDVSAEHPAMDTLTDAVFLAIDQALKPVPFNPQQQATVWSRIAQRLRTEPPQGCFTFRSEGMAWHVVLPGVQRKVLYQNPAQGYQITLWSLQSGAQLPAHTHEIDEECWVLEGEIQMDTHRVRAGELHIAVAGHPHPVITSPRGALLLLRSEIF